MQDCKEQRRLIVDVEKGEQVVVVVVAEDTNFVVEVLVERLVMAMKG